MSIKLYGPLFLSLLVQCVFMHNGIDIVREVPFVSVMPGYSRQMSEAYGRYIGYCFITVPFFLFVFSNDMSQLTYGYGKLLIIREYSKKRMMFKTIVKMMMRVMVLVIVMALMEDLMIVNKPTYSLYQEVMMLIQYTLAFCVLILMQYLLELFTSSQIANIILNVYILGSLLLWLPLFKIAPWLSYILIPNMAYLSRTCLFGNQWLVMGILLILLCLLITTCVRRFETIDIF